MNEHDIWPDTVQVNIRRGESGMLFAGSPQFPGLHMAERTYAEIWRKLPKTRSEHSLNGPGRAAPFTTPHCFRGSTSVAKAGSSASMRTPQT